MRTIIVGVAVLSIGAAGSVDAKEGMSSAPAIRPTCALLGAILTASAGPNSYGAYLYGVRPTTKAFDGKRFTVNRVTRVKDMTLNPATGDMRDVGYDAVAMRGPTGPLIVREQKVIGAPPQWVYSRDQKDAPGIRWRQGGEWAVKAGQTLWIVQEGPLAGYTLQVSACSPKWTR